MLNVLLSAGADKWIRNQDKQTPLEFAIGSAYGDESQTALKRVKQLLGM